MSSNPKVKSSFLGWFRLFLLLVRKGSGKVNLRIRLEIVKDCEFGNDWNNKGI